MSLTFVWKDGNRYQVREEALYAKGITLPCGTRLEWSDQDNPQLSVPGLVELRDNYKELDTRPPAAHIARANNMPLATLIS